jgi:hypothetical protein
MAAQTTSAAINQPLAKADFGIAALLGKARPDLCTFPGPAHSTLKREIAAGSEEGILL